MLLFVLLPFYTVGFFAFNVEFLFVIHMFAFFFLLYKFGSEFVSTFFSQKVELLSSHLSSVFSNYYFALSFVKMFFSFFRVFFYFTTLYLFNFYYGVLKNSQNLLGLRSLGESTGFSALPHLQSIQVPSVTSTSLNSDLGDYVFLY